ncbi:hypothetical protein ACFY2W_36565 [Streptomyces sp. NPDC001262]|uniref:hypothetical protein n=1 Tax=Streptomyces TaxID=1883 RepID=UPI0036979F0D
MKLTAFKRRTARTLAVLGATAAAAGLVGTGQASAVTPHKLTLCNKSGPAPYGAVGVQVHLTDRQVYTNVVQSGTCNTIDLTGNGGEHGSIWVVPQWQCDTSVPTCFGWAPKDGETNGFRIGIWDPKGTDITLTSPYTYTQK